MTTYGYDGAGRDVVAVWPVGVGSRAVRVVALREAVSEADGLRLCQELTGLSEALWDRYVNPESGEEAEDGPTADLEAGLRSPNLPDDAGLLLVSYDPVEEAAHRVGRLLADIGDAGVLEAVVAEVRRETEAVTAAELGDLSGRAAQAVVLDRVDASPVQVYAADQLLRAEPLGSEALLTSVDPAAACVATAHWLAAAASVAGRLTDEEAAEVFARADDIEACSIEVPSLVVQAIVEQGISPRDVVVDLLREAAAVREGRLPNVMGILAGVRDAIDQAEQVPEEERDAVREALMPSRATLLDPARAARDLLEHLLDGLHSTLVVYDDETDGDEDEFLDAVRTEVDARADRLS